jgi:histidine phosphotransferase ChpT
MNAIDLASLLCSRLCHDLLSPVGALNNGLELMADEQDPDMRERCLELLSESAKASANKLKFFRLAFGAGGGFGDQIDTREAKAALEGLFGAERGGDGLELVIRAEGPRILLDPALRETILKGSADGTVEPRAAGAWLAHELAAQGDSAIRLSDPADEVLLIGVTLPAQG